MDAADVVKLAAEGDVVTATTSHSVCFGLRVRGSGSGVQVQGSGYGSGFQVEG